MNGLFFKKNFQDSCKFTWFSYISTIPLVQVILTLHSSGGPKAIQEKTMKSSLNNQWEESSSFINFNIFCQNIKSLTVSYKCLWK